MRGIVEPVMEQVDYIKKNTDEIAAYLKSGVKKPGGKRLGLELEHFILKSPYGEAVPFYGERGVEAVLKRLSKRYGNARLIESRYFPNNRAREKSGAPSTLPEDEDVHVIGFDTPEFSITLEPAAQLEISIEPLSDISEIMRIYDEFKAGLDEVLKSFGLFAQTLGYQPKSKVAGLSLIPKERYYLMDRYFHGSGTMGICMMRGSASCQVSVDFESEEDFRLKLQAAYYLMPAFKLLMDNPYAFEGELSKERLLRTRVWRNVDDKRCGVLPDVFSETYGFKDYAAYLMNVPPIFMPDNDNDIWTGGKTLSELSCAGSDTNRKILTEDEIVHVISMVFPDVRVKHFLEIRGADSVERERVSAYLSLIKGTLYNRNLLYRISEEIKELRLHTSDIIAAEDSLKEKGFAGSIYGKDADLFIRGILEAAQNSLNDKEASALAPFFKKLNSKGKCLLAQTQIGAKSRRSEI